MVMHARKLPRIDDGYPDKREAQSYQSSQYPSKTGFSNHSDRYDRRRSPVRDSPSSRDSPRYLNKASYIERNKEKYERGTENSPGKKVNNNYAGGSSNANGGNHDKASRSASNPKDKTEVQKSAIRVCGDWSEHLSSTGKKKYYYNIKTEVSQWERPKEWNDALAVRPDRPERLSTESRTSNDKHSSKGNKIRHCSGGIEKREKHLRDVRHMVADSNPKPDKMYLFEKLQQGQTQLQEELRANKRLHSSDSKDVLRPNDDDTSNSYPNSSYTSRTRRDSEGSRGRQTSRNDQDELESPGSTPTSHRSGSTPLRCHNPVSNISSISSIPTLISQLSGGQNNQELTNQALQTLQKLQQALSKQIAAHQSSVSNQPSQPSVVQASPRQPLTEENLAFQQQLLQHQLLQQQQQQQQLIQQSMHGTLPSPSTPSVSLHRSPYINSQSTLQSVDTSSQQTVISMAMTVSPVAVTTGSTSIPITHTGNQVHRGNTVYGKFLGVQQTHLSSYQSPVDDVLGESFKNTDRGGGTDDRNCVSPAPSDTSSQGAPVDPDMFATSLPQKDTNLMSTLSQYYNEKLVSHVTGWQGELFEKQAKLYGDEALKIGNLISSQVSVELKRARSLVRVEEIQATLHEQRNLFLAQQIAELENMKPVSSVSSFLPTSTASSTS